MPQSYVYDVPDASLIPRVIEEVVERVIEEIQEINYNDILGDQIPEVADEHRRHFRGQRDALGARWAPLRPATVARKGHANILSETGELENSLIGGGPFSIRQVQNQELTFGTSVKHAQFHQHGFYNVQAKRNVPSRPPVGLSAVSVSRIVRNIADGMMDRLARG